MAPARRSAPGGAESLGRWRVEGDRYCSAWPPSEAWACYDVATGPGGAVDFTSDSGEVSRGRIAP